MSTECISSAGAKRVCHKGALKIERYMLKPAEIHMQIQLQFSLNGAIVTAATVGAINVGSVTMQIQIQSLTWRYICYIRYVRFGFRFGQRIS